MATTVTSSTLTVSVSESINLRGRQQGTSNTKRITGITNIAKTIITCLTAAEVSILGVNAATSTDMGKSYLAGQYDEDDVRYLRITNLDDENYVLLTMRTSGDTNAQEVAIKLDKGCSYIYSLDLDAGTEATLWGSASAINASASTTIYNLIDIVGVANGGDVELEVFVATV